MKTQLIPRRNWSIGFTDCCSYTDRDGVNPCVPYFMPIALCGTCLMAGR